MAASLQLVLPQPTTQGELDSPLDLARVQALAEPRAGRDTQDPGSHSRATAPARPSLVREHLSHAELIAKVLGRSHASPQAIARAAQLLNEVGSLSALAQLTPEAIMARSHFSFPQAERLWAACELGRRAAIESLQPQVGEVLDQAAISRWAQAKLAHLEHEEVWVVCLSAKMKLLSAYQVGRGGMHGCALLARDVLVPVLRSGCQGFILIHNHPSGSPEPSAEDIELTLALEMAATAISVPLVDHVIAAREGTASFFARGLLGAQKRSRR